MPEGPKSFLDNQRQVRDYVAASIRSLFQFHSDDQFSSSYAMDAASKRTPHLLRMNASNHLRHAISSLTRETKVVVMAITAKDKFQFLFRVLVGCSGQVQRRRHAGSAWGASRPIRIMQLVNRR